MTDADEVVEQAEGGDDFGCGWKERDYSHISVLWHEREIATTVEWVITSINL